MVSRRGQFAGVLITRAALLILAFSAVASASATLLLEEPYGKLGFFTPDGAHQFEVDTVITVESDAGPIDPGRKPNWRITELELIDARDRAAAGIGGPGGPPIPRGIPKGGQDPKFIEGPRLPR